MQSAKTFHTRQLIGQNIVVQVKKDTKFIGTLMEYFERNDNLVLTNWTMLKLDEETGKWNVEESGDLVILKGSFWKSIRVPSAKHLNAKIK